MAPVAVDVLTGEGAVGVDPVDDLGGEEPELLRGERRRELGEQPVGGVEVGGVDAAVVDGVEGTQADVGLLGRDVPVALRGRKRGLTGASRPPVTVTCSLRASHARTRRAASPGERRRAQVSTVLRFGWPTVSGSRTDSATRRARWSTRAVRLRVCSKRSRKLRRREPS